jgi:hypothetical protein
LASGDPIIRLAIRLRFSGRSALEAKSDCFSMIFSRRNRKTHGREPLTF